MAEPEPLRPTRFAPTVLLGVASALLAVVASTRAWAVSHPEQGDHTWVLAGGSSGGQVPLATALALVVLAAWGALLVTRGRVRRVVATLGALAAAGLLLTTLWGRWSLTGSLREQLTEVGVTGTVESTGWFWVGALAALGCVVTTLAALRLLGRWPEMSGRYDAPASTTAGTVAERDPSHLDLWKAIDEGRDPTNEG
jgi:uncharacterized membrane protein (TIGR02234 family)